MKETPLSMKITLGFGLLIGVLCLVIWIYHFSVDSALSGYEDLLEKDITVAHHADNTVIYMLQCRRDEDNFLLHKDLQYLEKFRGNMARLREEIKAIIALTSATKLTEEHDAAARCLDNANKYENAFKALVEAWKIRGLDHNSGYQGKFRASAHTLASTAPEHEAGELFLALLQMRRHEKDYTRTKSDKYFKKFQNDIAGYRRLLEKSHCDTTALEAQLKALGEYETAFKQYLDAGQSKDLQNQHYQNMRSAAQAMEDAIDRIYVPNAKALVLEIRKNEKDYLLRGNEKYIKKTHSSVSELFDAVKNTGILQKHVTDMETDLQSYKNAFDALVNTDKEIDILTAAMNAAAKQIEPSAKIINSRAQIQAADRVEKTTGGAKEQATFAMYIGMAGIFAALIIATFFARNVRRVELEQKRLSDLASQDLWIKDGTAKLSDIMRGEQDTAILSKNVIRFLAEYAGAQMASLYLMDEANKTLTLSSGYAFNKRKDLNERIKLGEGIAGQAALEKRLLSVTNVPVDYLSISSSLGDAIPRNILVLPLLHEEELVGLVEFASFKEPSDVEIAFLNNIAESTAIAFNSAQSRLKMQDLLEKTQQQSEELEAQAEELQSQQEELKSSNMELEQQSEELRVSNEELEDKTESLERQKAEIERRTDEVEKAKHDVEDKARELELASKYKSEFLANMSHELRTPLNSLLILAKVLAGNDEGNLTEGQVESAKVIYSGGQDLLFLINEILDLSKVEAGMMDVHHEEVKLETIVDSVRQQFQAGAEEKNLDFGISVEPDLPPSIVIDEQRLGQILRNFLSNAIKFTEQGSVSLDIHRPGEDVRFSCEHLTRTNAVAFSVRDTGPGIPEEKREAIFEAFQQADGSTSRKYGGTGLGLSISHALAHLLNGEIQLESEVGEDSIFTLFLPLERRRTVGKDSVAPSEKRKPPQRRAVHPRLPSSAPSPEFLPDDRKDIKEGDRSILIIEDDAKFAKVLIAQVQKKGFKCLAAGDGSTSLQMAAEYKPSAIILDLGLPDIDGATVLDGLKYDLATRHIPVHVMSGREKTTDIMRKGAVGFLTKPVKAEDIHMALGKIEDILDDSVKHVLVVEDDKNNRKAIETLLAAEGVEITGVGSGNEARDLITEQSFDCVILDLGLPDMTGFELLQILEEDHSVVLPPTIVYTGKELTADELRELGRYTANVVVKGANSPERLLDETSLFLHTIESSLPSGQKQMLRMLHDPEQLLQGRKVLLVDDDLRNSFALSKALRMEGLTVALAENGKVALECLDKEDSIELVLMDIMMPVMDGYETMTRIREQARFKDLPIVALTAKAMVEDRAKCIDAGANDYLAKPIDVDKLMSLMRVLLYR